MEIERKFLCNDITFDLDQFKKSNIEQGYISSDPVIRIRKNTDAYWLTIKSSGLLIREEYEMKLTKEEYDNLKKKIEYNIIEKDRYFLPLNNGLIAELDIYHNELKGLLTVEVEFSSEKEANEFSPPKWFGKDVTLDPRYKNSNLCKNGIPI